MAPYQVVPGIYDEFDIAASMIEHVGRDIIVDLRFYLVIIAYSNLEKYLLVVVWRTEVISIFRKYSYSSVLYLLQ